jgi:putative heme degradation protein
LRFDAQLSALPVIPTPGDFNLDGHVDSADIASMLSAMTDLHQFQLDNGLTAAQTVTIANVNGDSGGIVDNADIQSLLVKLRNGGGSSNAVPEPPSLLLMLGALVGLGFTVRLPDRANAHKRP